MKKFIVCIVTIIFGLSTFAQSVDKPFVVPKICWPATSLNTTLFKGTSVITPFSNDSLLCKSFFSFKPLLSDTDYNIDDTKSSVVVKPLNYNLSTPNIAMPPLQTMNWWQALGTIGMGLTRGLVFDNYNSSYTLDD